MDLTPITTPQDWTSEKDFESYEDRFDEAENYFADALERIADGYAELTDAVDSALAYFQRHDHRLVPVYPGTLTLAEKLYRLSVITNTRNNDYKYKHRFAVHLHACQWVDAERQRVMQAYYLGDEKVWLHPLCDLSDAIGCATNEFVDAMKVEHKDYKL